MRPRELYVAPETVSTFVVCAPRIFESRVFAFDKNGSLSEALTTAMPAIRPPLTVTLTVMGPLKPVPAPVYVPSR